MTDTIDFKDFLNVDIRVGTIINAKNFEQARNPAYILHIDFGKEIGEKKTSAQITKNYTPEGLIGKQVLAVVNFPAKQIGPIMSEVLVLGLNDQAGEITLIAPDGTVPNGGRLH